MDQINKPHVVINYISLGHHHVARLRAIANVMTSKGWVVTCLETFAKDSDYAWNRYSPKIDGCHIKTVFSEDSQTARTLPNFKKKIIAVLNDIKPDVMIVSGYALPESHVIRRWCNNKSIHLILLSDSQEKDQKRNFFKELVKKSIVSKHKAAFVAGESAKEYAIKLGISANKVWKGSCVVDNDFWLAKSIKIRSESEKYCKMYKLPEKYILCISRFVKKKNIPFLIKAYCKFEKEYNFGYKLLLVGDGPLRKDINDSISSEWKDHIILRPFQQSDGLAVYYSMASCFVLPSSHNEQWGLVVNEAMACGLPVLVSNTCGCGNDLIRAGINGYIFDPYDAKDLVNCLNLVTASEKNRSELGHNSLSIINQFSCKWAANNLANAVISVLS